MANPSFVEGTDLQFAWDSTSLGLLKTCPRKYYYSMILGYTSRFESVHLTFGILYHSALELYDRAKAQGESHDEALDRSVDFLLRSTWDKATGRPWMSESEQKNRFTLVRTVVWYLEEFKEDSLKTLQLASGKPAVELSFKLDLGTLAPNGQPYVYCGHMDRVAMLGDQLFVVDRKTTGSALGQKFFEQFSPHGQFSGYVFAAKVGFGMAVQGLIVDAAQIGVTFSRFQREIVHRDEAQTEEWYGDTLQWITQAEHYAAAKHWPMNDQSCDKFGGCGFRGVCSRSPKARQMWLDQLFVKRQWNPLASRDV